MKKTVKQAKFFRERKNRKNRIHNLKGVGKIILPRAYSFSQRGNVIHLSRNGEEIHSFPNGVTVKEIEEYVLEYEAILLKEEKTMWLKEYCTAPMSICKGNCDECDSPNDKNWALDRKKEGKKVVKPIKTGGLKESLEKKDVLLKKPNSESKEIISGRQRFTRGWAIRR